MTSWLHFGDLHSFLWQTILALYDRGSLYSEACYKTEEGWLSCIFSLGGFELDTGVGSPNKLGRAAGRHRQISIIILTDRHRLRLHYCSCVRADAFLLSIVSELPLLVLILLEFLKMLLSMQHSTQQQSHRNLSSQPAQEYLSSKQLTTALVWRVVWGLN